MSINACTIDSVTVDGFCGAIRAKVFASLVDQKYGGVQPPTPHIPGGGGWAGGMGPGSFPVPPRHSPFPFDHVPSESPYITVTADLFGIKGQESLSKNAQDVFVVARNVDINDADDIAISIKNVDVEEADILVMARNVDINDPDNITISVKNVGIEEAEDDEDITVNISGLEIF